MADTPKNSNLVVVVVVILACCTVPTFCYTQDLQQYQTTEVSQRSFGILDLFDSNSWLIRFGSPIFTLVTFGVSCYQVAKLMRTYIPGLEDIFSIGLPLLSQLPTEMVTARQGKHHNIIDVSFKIWNEKIINV